MTAPRAVPAFDEIEDCEMGFHLRPEPMPVKELALDVAKKLSQSALS